MEALDLNHRPSVFEYTDYRKYLGDSYHYLKANYSHFSFRYFSKRAGFASPNFLKLVIEGKRNLSPASVVRFASALKLPKHEADFFTELVQFNQSKNPTQRSDSARRMMQSKGYQKVYPLQQAEFAYYANWYYIPVREVVGLDGFCEDLKWIAQQIFPAISEDQVAQAIKDLETLGLLVRDKGGGLTQAQRSVSTPNEVNSAAIVRYHKDMLGLAADSIDNVPRTNRDISAVTVPLSRVAAAKVKTMIQDFRKEILAVASEDDAAEVIYQINMQLFPLSRWDSGGEDE